VNYDSKNKRRAIMEGNKIFIEGQNISFIYYNEKENIFKITSLKNDKELAYKEKGYKHVGTVSDLYFQHLLNLNSKKREKEIEELKKEFK